MKITNKEKQRILELHYNTPMKPFLVEQLMNYAQKKMNVNSTTPYPYTWDSGPNAPKPSTVQTTSLEPWDYKSNNDDNPKSFDEFVEGVRKLLMNPISIGVEVFISYFTIGKVSIVIIYGLLLAYDVNKLIEGDTSGENWLNIIFEILAILGAVHLGPIFRELSKSAKNIKFNGIVEFLNWLKTTKVWTSVSTFLEKIANGLNIFSSLFKTLGEWLNLTMFVVRKFSEGIYLAFKSLATILSKILSFINSKIIIPIEGVIRKGVQLTRVSQNLVEPITKGTLLGGGFGGYEGVREINKLTSIKNMVEDEGFNWEETKKEFGSDSTYSDNELLRKAWIAGWRPKLDLSVPDQFRTKTYLINRVEKGLFNDEK